MKPNTRKWRKKSPHKHRRYGEKRNRDYERETKENNN